MIIKCAWCGKDLGVAEPVGDNAVSHGICPVCLAAMMSAEAAAIRADNEAKKEDAVCLL